ncbi:MAG: hypothetical protein PVG44_15890 [Desulfobacterales bacterium]
MLILQNPKEYIRETKEKESINPQDESANEIIKGFVCGTIISAIFWLGIFTIIKICL